MNPNFDPEAPWAAATFRRNACHNRKAFLPTLVVQDGYIDRGLPGVPKREPFYKEIPDRMRRDCVYSTDPLVGSKDPGCVGCRWKQEPRDA